MGLASSARELATAEDAELLASSLESLAISIRSSFALKDKEATIQPKKKMKKGKSLTRCNIT